MARAAILFDMRLVAASALRADALEDDLAALDEETVRIGHLRRHVHLRHLDIEHAAARATEGMAMGVVRKS